MNYGGGIIGLIILVLDVMALIEIWKSSRPDGEKLLWTIVILLMPLLGLLIYYLAGRKTSAPLP